jgi:hypothetical protein
MSDYLAGVNVVDISAHGNARHRDDEWIGMTGKRPRIKWVMLLLGLFFLPAKAHNGPPFPIIENKNIGPCVISLWTHPDIGVGTFFVFVEPAPGKSIPADLKFNLGIQPESKRLPEVIYSMNREDDHGQLQYKASVDFDRDDFFRVRLVWQDAQEKAETFSRVEATPVGFGRWDLLLYLLPFLAVGLLWFRGITRRRTRLRRERTA